MSARSILARAQCLVPQASGGSLVMAYHLIGAPVRSAVNLSVDTFQRQLDHLTSHYRVVPLARAIEQAATRQASPLVALTFDDAFLNFAEIVWPLLKKRGLPCTLYAPVGFVSGASGAPLSGANLPPCTFADLRRLADEGVEIGSHGYRHVNLRRASGRERAREIDESRVILERELGRKVESFCYAQAKYDHDAVQRVSRRYRNAVGAGGRRFYGGDVHRIPRLPIRSDDTAFASMVAARVWLPEAVAHRLRQLRG